MTDISIAVSQTPAPPAQEAAVHGTLGDYFALLKPGVMSLAVFTALAGMIAAPGSLHPVIAVSALIFIALGAGGAGALNMWYDADIDRLMSRTAMRPIPRNRVPPHEALSFGLFLAGGSVVCLGVLVNWISAGLLALTIAYYFVIYTMWLKRRTPQNIVIGGAAGAFPPMIGWAVTTGSVSLEGLVLFAIIFLWTPPHFWALAVNRARDYERAGVPMMPNVAGKDHTRLLILIYSVLTALVGVVPAFIGLGGRIYLAVSVMLGGAFIGFAVNLYLRRSGHASDRACRAMFSFSILYLFGMFAALIADHALGLVR